MFGHRMSEFDCYLQFPLLGVSAFENPVSLFIDTKTDTSARFQRKFPKAGLGLCKFLCHAILRSDFVMPGDQPNVTNAVSVFHLFSCIIIERTLLRESEYCLRRNLATVWGCLRYGSESRVNKLLTRRARIFLRGFNTLWQAEGNDRKTFNQVLFGKISPQHPR